MTGACPPDPMARREAPPLACFALDALRARLDGRSVALFLDYDGTLTPIVDRPDRAVLSDAVRTALERLSRYCTVCVVSGRGREDVARLVGLGGVVYAGAHGFDIKGPGGLSLTRGEAFFPELQQAAMALREALADIEGVVVEDKTHAIAIHFRMADPAEAPRVERAVDATRAGFPRLRKTGGKMIFELRPDLDWDKGKAVLWLLEMLRLGSGDIFPVYIGDDETDEDAFRALRGHGLGVLVSEHPRETQAEIRLLDPDEVRLFLEALGDWLEPDSPEPVPPRHRPAQILPKRRRRE